MNEGEYKKSKGAFPARHPGRQANNTPVIPDGEPRFGGAVDPGSSTRCGAVTCVRKDATSLRRILCWVPDLRSRCSLVRDDN
jgi:hypothetical protein